MIVHLWPECWVPTGHFQGPELVGPLAVLHLAMVSLIDVSVLLIMKLCVQVWPLPEVRVV